MFEDSVLLRIKRSYNKDEAVAFLIKEVSELKVKVGILKSEKEELVFKNKQLNEKQFEAERMQSNPVANDTKPLQKVKLKKLWLEDELFASMSESLILQKQKNKELENKVTEWRNKYFSLLAQATHSIRNERMEDEGNEGFPDEEFENKD